MITFNIAPKAGFFSITYQEVGRKAVVSSIFTLNMLKAKWQSAIRMGYSVTYKLIKA